MHTEHLFHISEEERIAEFVPRPSTQYYPSIRGDVVFAINDKRLANYLLPRDCPRVCYWQKEGTTEQDMADYFADTSAQNAIVIEEGWLEKLANTRLYCYEFAMDDFELLDENAGYYVSYQVQKPINTSIIYNPLNILTEKGILVLALPSLKTLADRVAKSTLGYSIIRMRNARV